MTDKELLAAVRAHANANYEKDGWDYLVECFSDEDILECIGTATTAKEAIRACKRTMTLLDERRNEVTNEIF